jgi:hypothetical protein
MPTIPSAINFEDRDLRDFKTAFTEFVDAEKKRLTRDKEILTSLDTLSDLDTLVSSSLDQAVRASAKTLDTLIAGE